MQAPPTGFISAGTELHTLQLFGPKRPGPRNRTAAQPPLLLTSSCVAGSRSNSSMLVSGVRNCARCLRWEGQRGGVQRWGATPASSCSQSSSIALCSYARNLGCATPGTLASCNNKCRDLETPWIGRITRKRQIVVHLYDIPYQLPSPGCGAMLPMIWLVGIEEARREAGHAPTNPAKPPPTPAAQLLPTCPHTTPARTRQ